MTHRCPSVLSSLERHDLSPNRLTPEVTEDVLMRHPDRAPGIMRSLHRAGITIHLDAFGTGRSSLQTLHRFPVDAIKIDRSFISNLTTSDRSTELVGALVSRGRSLGLAVVADGVEAPEQPAFVREIGCATGPGYLCMPAVSRELAPGPLGTSRTIRTWTSSTSAVDERPEEQHVPEWKGDLDPAAGEQRLQGGPAWRDQEHPREETDPDRADRDSRRR